uniref:FACT complex subunit n=1 Tax=Arcella intermedia TaxID=1963864 RepID=A0A6B2L474_9EUKA
MEGATEKEVKVKDKEKGSKEKKRKREVSTKKSSQKKRSKRINLSEVEHQNNKTDKVKDSGPSKVEHQNTKIDKVKDSEPSKVGHENSKTDKKDEDSDLAIMVNPPSRKSRRLQTKQPKELKDRFELTGIFIRPPLGGGKKKGIVKNTGSGIHYNTNSADVLIPFKSIEHMILCPNEGGTITLLHIYLKEPITYPGRVKTTQHIQFYNESNKQKDSRKMKMAFKEFISSIKEKEFHIETTSSKPIQGMPQKSMLKLEITPECLVSLLLDQGFFIILLKNVLVAYFERAEVSKSFDLVFILQDFSIQPIHSIPSPDLESLQRWLRIASVPFYQGSHSLDWTKIITNITNIKEKGEFKKGDWNTLFGGEESQDQQQSILDSEEETESGEWKPNMSLEDKDDFSIPKADAAL